MHFLRRLLVLAALMGLAPAALAHLMPAQKGTVNLQGGSAFVVISIPVSALVQVDASGDGRLSADELDAQRSAIESQVAWGVRLFSSDEQGRLEFVQVDAGLDENEAAQAAGPRHVVALMRIGFRTPPRQLGIVFNLFGKQPQEQHFSVKAMRSGATDVLILTPGKREQLFFRPAGQVFGDYTWLGVQHVLGGLDHLLFLLTVIVAASGWRYWLSVLTSFTIAHSITLSLALLGIWRVSAELVEPLIAASIVLMALLNLLAPRQGGAERLVLVFACGLLHGLGFASAMDARGLDGAYQITSLLGFNLGIEIGQVLCLLTWLALLGAARQCSRPGGTWIGDRWSQAGGALAGPHTATRFISSLAMVAGLFWMVQRMALPA